MAKRKSGKPPVTKKQKIIDEVKAIALILVVVLTFRSTFFEPYRIPSGSMIPTLMIGDFILVNKFAYGFKVPFTDLSIGTLGINWKPVYLFGKKDPKAGEVIVFKFPKDPSINYIKRVVGVPGDTIEIKNKMVYVNGKPLAAEEFDGKEIMADMDDKFKKYNFKFYNSKTGEREHVTQINADSIYKAYLEKITVPKDHYFVMGDNRDFSEDSRFWGFVPRNYIKGRAILVWFSIILPFISDSSFKFRYYRIGKKIH